MRALALRFWPSLSRLFPQVLPSSQNVAKKAKGFSRAHGQHHHSSARKQKLRHPERAFRIVAPAFGRNKQSKRESKDLHFQSTSAAERVPPSTPPKCHPDAELREAEGSAAAVLCREAAALGESNRPRTCFAVRDTSRTSSPTSQNVILSGAPPRTLPTMQKPTSAESNSLP
jgi:hypothetical protein